MKRILSLILSAVLIMCVLPFDIAAAEQTFLCSNSVSAVYNSTTATLTVNGNGKMPDYAKYESTQWMSIRNQVKSLVISSGITSVGDYAFASFISLKTVSLPESLERVGAHAFEHCTALESINMPDSVTEIGEYAFSECTALKLIPISQSLKKIAEGTYNGCSAITTAFSIPEGCTVIYDYAFYGVKAPITISPKTEYIGNFAFAYCGYIREIAFPETLTYIGEGAFQNCTNLAKITFSESIGFIGCNAFLKTSWMNSAAPVITVVNGITLSVKADPKTDVLTIPVGTVVISPKTAASFVSIKEVVIPFGVKEIRDDAFYNLPNLYSVTIPSSVEEIGTKALGYTVDSSGTVSKINGFTVYGHAGSVAEQYAEQNGFLFMGVHESDGVLYATDSGLKNVRFKCAVCGENFGEKAFDPSEHTWSAEQLEINSCTEDGYSFKQCEDCGIRIVVSILPATGHTADGVYRVGEYPSCNHEGYLYQLCRECGEPCQIIYIEKTGHTPAESYITVNEPTCESDGLKVLYCTVCGEKLDEEVIPHTGHTYPTKTEIIIKAEYNKPGLKAIRCTVCGKISSYEIYEMRIVKGDINMDGRFNSKDVVLFKEKYSKGVITDEEKSRMDYNGDRRVNTRDLTEMMMALGGR